MAAYKPTCRPMSALKLPPRGAIKMFIIIIIIIIIFRPRYSIPEERKKYTMQYKKVQKSSWNEPYSSSSFTKQSCSKVVKIPGVKN